MSVQAAVLDDALTVCERCRRSGRVIPADGSQGSETLFENRILCDVRGALIGAVRAGAGEIEETCGWAKAEILGSLKRSYQAKAHRALR